MKPAGRELVRTFLGRNHPKHRANQRSTQVRLLVQISHQLLDPDPRVRASGIAALCRTDLITDPVVLSQIHSAADQLPHRFITAVPTSGPSQRTLTTDDGAELARQHLKAGLVELLLEGCGAEAHVETLVIHALGLGPAYRNQVGTEVGSGRDALKLRHEDRWASLAESHLEKQDAKDDARAEAASLLELQWDLHAFLRDDQTMGWVLEDLKDTRRLIRKLHGRAAAAKVGVAVFPGTRARIAPRSFWSPYHLANGPFRPSALNLKRHEVEAAFAVAAAVCQQFERTKGQRLDDDWGLTVNHARWQDFVYRPRPGDDGEDLGGGGYFKGRELFDGKHSVRELVAGKDEWLYYNVACEAALRATRDAVKAGRLEVVGWKGDIGEASLKP